MNARYQLELTISRIDEAIKTMSKYTLTLENQDAYAQLLTARAIAAAGLATLEAQGK